MALEARTERVKASNIEEKTRMLAVKKKKSIGNINGSWYKKSIGDGRRTFGGRRGERKLVGGMRGREGSEGSDVGRKGRGRSGEGEGGERRNELSNGGWRRVR